MRINSVDVVTGGNCATCGALYILDPTSKNVGEVTMQGLALTAERLSKDIADMVAGDDYDDIVLSYDWRTHRSSGEPRSFMDGHGRLYVIRAKKKN